MTQRRRPWLRVLPPFVLAALLVAPSAGAAVRIRSIDTSGLPAVHLVVIAPTGAQTPVLRENGLPVAGYQAVNLGSEKVIVLALDRSQSMSGRPFRQAIAAAQSFAGAAGPNDHVGVVAFGHTAVALESSSGPAQAESALGGLTVDTQSGTALYDSIVIAAQQLVHDARPGRAIVVVTDGADVSSTHTIDDAIAAARAAHAAVYTIGIAGPSFNPTDLKRIAASTGGSYREATTTASLAGLYTGLENEFARTWQLSYLSAQRSGGPLKLAVAVPGSGAATRTVELADSATQPPAPTPLIPSFAYSNGGTLVVGLCAGALLFLATGFWFASRRGTELRARIEPHLAGGAPRHRARRRRHDHTAMRTRIADGIEQLLGGLRQFKRVQLSIDRADLPLRAGELVAISGGSMILCGLLFAVLAAPALLVLLGLVLGAAAPLAYVSLRAVARIRQFDNQLPDLLITVAASLKAGHSFRQGMQAVVDEGADPAAKEFRRVLTETQLGKPMDEALLDLAARIGSKNLTFVINAVTIQRQIGGSLAGLFDMVADTVRQRQQFARKVKGLTAMGRMSAYVLIAMPFFLAGIITMMNPHYMAPLYHTSTGHMMLMSALAMILVGSTILRKIASFRG